MNEKNKKKVILTPSEFWNEDTNQNHCPCCGKGIVGKAKKDIPALCEDFNSKFSNLESEE